MHVGYQHLNWHWLRFNRYGAGIERISFAAFLFFAWMLSAMPVSASDTQFDLECIVYGASKNSDVKVGFSHRYCFDLRANVYTGYGSVHHIQSVTLEEIIIYQGPLGGGGYLVDKFDRHSGIHTWFVTGDPMGYIYQERCVRKPFTGISKPKF